MSPDDLDEPGMTQTRRGWGYACCQVTDFAARCPHGPEEPEAIADRDFVFFFKRKVLAVRN